MNEDASTAGLIAKEKLYQHNAEWKLFIILQDIIVNKLLSYKAAKLETRNSFLSITKRIKLC